MHKLALRRRTSVCTMNTSKPADRLDGALLRALQRRPDATTLALAEATGLSRNTVRARLRRYEDEVLEPFDRRVSPAFLGYPLRAYIFATVEQQRLDEVGAALARIREVISVEGLAGTFDLLVHVAAKDAEGLYGIAGQVLAIDGVTRTETGLVMYTLVEPRLLQLAP